MATQTVTKLVGPTGHTCPSCGQRTVYAAMFPVHAYGADGGSSDVDHHECSSCDHEWEQS